MIPSTPDQLRIAAREATYANSQDEKVNVARVDGEVYAKVRQYENIVLSNARAFISDKQTDVIAADELETAIRREVRYALDEGATPDAVAVRHTQLVNSARLAIAALERAERESLWHAARVADPYSYYQTLATKYRAIAPQIAV
jgi:hypothetical protein